MQSLLAAMGLVFVAELGDKTQLLALGFGARHRLGPVLAGVAIGYAATNVLSVLAGGLLGAALPVRAIGLAGGVLFVAFAAWTWHDTADVNGPASLAAGHRSVVPSVAGAMFLAELGDKTMLATATLAAQGQPVPTWIGASAGMILSGALGVVLGRACGARLPERATRLGAAGLFAAFGVGLIVANV